MFVREKGSFPQQKVKIKEEENSDFASEITKWPERKLFLSFTEETTEKFERRNIGGKCEADKLEEIF